MFEQTTLFWALAIPAAFLVGMSKGGLTTVGVLAVPILSMAISPVAAAGILLPIYIVSDMFGLWAFRREYSALVLRRFLPGAAAGILAGWVLASVVHDAHVRLIVGTIGIAFCLDRFLRRNQPDTVRPAGVATGTFWGLIAGFTSFVSHSGAPPFQIYALPLGLSKMTFAGTATIVFAVINALKLPPYILLGQVTLGNLPTIAVLAVAAVAGTFAGLALTRRIPERPFFIFVTVALFLVSVKLLVDGIRGTF